MTTKPNTMNTAAAATPRIRRLPLSPLGKITFAAVALNGLTFIPIVFSTGPRPIILAHIVVPLIVAAIVASGVRWTPAVGALLGGSLFIENVFMFTDKLTHPDSAASFALAMIVFASELVAFITGLGATVQNYRRPAGDRPAPPWTRTATLALAALVVGGTWATAIHPRSTASSFSPTVLATLPTVRIKNYLYDQQAIHAKVGETIAFQLVNTDKTTHYLDIDELNVHTLVSAGTSNVVLFKPTTPGTYTYYCHPHANKAGGTGMLGHLTVTP